MRWLFFSNYWWQLILVAIASYLIGGINFAIIFSKAIKHEDIRTVGSGNAGTTNVFRIFGLRMGSLTFLCDALKGIVACLLCKYIFNQTGYVTEFMYFAGLFVVMGHIFPVYHNFKGGKGVATSIGVCAVLQPMLMLCCIIPICVVIFVTDRMSVMSISFSVFMIVWHWMVLNESVGDVACALLTAMFGLVIFAHRHNIVRIFTGKELPTGVRRKIFRKDKREEKQLRKQVQNSNLQLVFPCERYLQSYTEAYEEDLTYRNDEDIMFCSPKIVIEQSEKFRKGVDLSQKYHPVTMLWLIEDDEFIGSVNIRHELNEQLSDLVGNIDYEVRFGKCGKGYGTRLLALALRYAKERLGIKCVLITCDVENKAAAKVIENNGGVLENIVNAPNDNGSFRKIKRYWINIK